MKLEDTLQSSGVVVTHLYFILFMLCALFASWRLIHLIMVSKKGGWDIKKIVHCMIPIGLFLRAAWFGILLWGYYEDGTLLLIAPLPYQTASSIVIGSLPGYWSITNYMLVWLFWVYLSQSSGYAQTSRMFQKIRDSYIVLNVLMYSIWITLMVLIFKCSCSMLAHTIEASFATGLNLLMATLFAVIGPRMYFGLKKALTSNNSPKQHFMLHRVWVLSVIICVSFFTRALVLGLSFFIFTTTYSIFVATCCYLVLLESFPEMLILYVMGKRREKREKRHGRLIGVLKESTPLIQ